MKAVVFDLDGTLIDSAPDIHAAVAKMLAEEGAPALDLATVTSFIGNGLPHLVKLVIGATGLDMARHGALSARVLDHYNAASSVLTELYPGVREAIENLHRNDFVLGLCTNKPEAPARTILDQFGLADMFSAVIGGDSLPERKPHPAPLQATFAALGTEGIYVGDSEVDAETAHRATVPFALFTGGYRKTPADELPHSWRFDAFEELPPIVMQSAQRAAQ